MKLLDLPSLLPEAVELHSPFDLPLWEMVAKQVYGHDCRVVLTDEDALAWVRRLSIEDVWGEVTVIADRSRWLFWRIVDERVLVEDETGRRMPKPMRTTEPDLWAAALVARDHRKTQTKAVLKAQPTEMQALLTMWEAAAPKDDDLIDTDGVYHLVDITEIDEVEEQIRRHATFGGTWGWDTETDSTGEDDNQAPNPWDANLVGLSISIAPRTGWYFPVAHLDDDDQPRPWNLPKERVLDVLRTAYAATTSRRVFAHNVKYDFSVVTNHLQSVSLRMVYEDWLPKTNDTMLLAQVTAQVLAGLKDLAKRRLHLNTINFKRLTRGRSFAYVDAYPATVYAAQDADWPLRLWPLLMKDAERLQTIGVYEKELPLIEYFMRMEKRGALVNRKKLEEHTREAETQTEFWRTFTFNRLAVSGVDVGWAPLQFNQGKIPEPNLGSDKQVAIWLFADAPHGMGIRPQELTKSGAPSTGEKAINALIASGSLDDAQHAVVRGLLAYRGWIKQLEAFLYPMRHHIRSDGRVHASFRQMGADATGRTSCSGPNLQQVDKHLRDLFEPTEDGEFAALDYSQIELRVLAAHFNEPAMLATYNLPRFLPDGKPNPEADIHDQTQKRVGLPNRTLAKNFNFGKAFGAGAATLSQTAAMPLPVVEEFIRAYDEAYPAYTANLRAEQRRARESGLVRNWAGRVRVLPPITSKQQRSENNRLVANTPVQGGARDCIAWAMREIIPLLREYEDFGIHPWNMVHDELDFERERSCPDTIWVDFLSKVQAKMIECNPWKDIVPFAIDVEVGADWSLMADPDDEETFQVFHAFETALATDPEDEDLVGAELAGVQ